MDSQTKPTGPAPSRDAAADLAADEGITSTQAYNRGLRVGLAIPAFILACTGAGFGALAHDAGVSGWHSAFMSIVLYATPAQVVLVDQIARGSSLWAAAFAVTLTAIRLLPMTVTLMPYVRAPGVKPWQYVLASHFVAITGWSEAFRRLPHLPERLRMPCFLGIGTALVLALLAGTIAGNWLAGAVPPLLTSALLFMTPLYFTMSIILNARQRIDWAALGAGAIIGPIAYIAVPGFDLLLSGLIGGTIAFLIGGRGRKARPS